MMLEFSKMHGLGNDFVVIDAINQVVELSPEQVRRLADRHRGIGCDQLLLVERPRSGQADFRYRIFNADGGEVSQCGNGARCFMRFVHDLGLSDKHELHVETANGQLLLVLEDDDQITVNMGEPRLEPRDIPFDAPVRASTYSLEVAGEASRDRRRVHGQSARGHPGERCRNGPGGATWTGDRAPPAFPARGQCGIHANHRF